MKPQSCKNKGRRFQQRIARDIIDAFPHLREDDAISTSMGAGGEDIRLSTAARKALPISIECKCQEKLNVWTCLEQARSNTPSGATPCLVFSRNRAQTYAVVPWCVLLELYRALYNSGEDGIPTGLSDILVSLESYVTAEVQKRRTKNGKERESTDPLKIHEGGATEAEESASCQVESDQEIDL